MPYKGLRHTSNGLTECPWFSFGNRFDYHPHKTGTRCHVFWTVNQGGVKSKNRRGPRVEPCGTPEGRGDKDTVQWPRMIWKLLSARQDLNHSNAAPFMSTLSLRREILLLWSTVSKAAVESRSRRTELPESVKNHLMVFVAFFRLWCGELRW